MAEVAEGLASDLIVKGVRKILSRKRLTTQDLTVLLLHEQSSGLSRIEKGVEGIAGELRELRRQVLPLPNQARDIAEIRARVERIETKVK